MFNPWVGNIPWRRKWQPTPVFLPREFRGQRSLVGYIVHGVTESQTQLSNYYSSNSCVFGWFLIGGCCEHACPSFCVDRSFPFFLVDSKEWNFQGHGKLCLTLPDQFPWLLHHFPLLSAEYVGPISPHPHQNLYFSAFSDTVT